MGLRSDRMDGWGSVRMLGMKVEYEDDGGGRAKNLRLDQVR